VLYPLPNFFQISDLVIGLTIVAVGTSLPELAAAISAALKNEHDIVIGNVIGSNLFNILAVLPIPGIIYPSYLTEQVIRRDLLTMFIITLVLFLFAYGFKGKGHIKRVEGLVLLLGYVGYLIWLVYSEQV